MIGITHNQYLKLFSDIAINHRDINSFYSGDLDNYTANQSETLNPVTLWVVIDDDVINGKTDKPKYNFIVLDWVNQDSSNLDEVYSDTLRISKDILALLRQPYYEAFFKVQEDVTFTPFNEKFDSDVAGWQFSLTFDQPFIYDACEVNTTGLPTINYETLAINSSSYAWGGITGTLSNQTDLQNALNAKVPTSRTLTINGVTYDLSANRSWTVTVGGETLAQTLVLGNSTGGTDINISSGDSVLFDTTKGLLEYNALNSKLILSNLTSLDYLSFGDLSGVLLKATNGAIYADGVGNTVGLNWNESANQIQAFNLNGFWGIGTNDIQLWHDTKLSLDAPTIQSSGNLLFSGSSYIDTTSTAGTDTLSIGGINADIINIGRSGATVNILGNALYEYAANQYVLDKLITLNYNGAVSSGAGVGFEIEENSIITGYFKTNASRNGFDILTPAIAYKSTISLASLTADKTHTLPNVNGTLSTVDGGQTFTSAIWNGTVIGATYGGTGLTSVTANRILYASATNTWGTSASLTFNGTIFKVGATAFTSSLSSGIVQIEGTDTYFAAQSTSALGTSGFRFGQNNSIYGTLQSQGTSVSGTWTGTTVLRTSATELIAGGTTGANTMILAATTLYNLIGTTATNFGTKLDSSGFRVDQIQNLHTANRAGVTFGSVGTNGINFQGLIGTTTSSAIYMNQSSPSSSNYTLFATAAGQTVLNGTDINFRISNANRLTLGTTGHFADVSQGVAGTSQLRFTISNKSSETAGTNVPKILFTIGTLSWATGALAAADFVQWTQPSVLFTGASTATLAATLAINGAPIASTNASITTSVGLLVKAGSSVAAGTTTAYGAYFNAPTGATNNYALGLEGNLNIVDSYNIILGTTTGTKIGTATTQKMGLWNVTPIVQPASGNQAAVTTTVATTAATNIAPYGYTTQAQADDLITEVGQLKVLVNQLRSDLVSFGAIKGSA